VQAYRVGNTEFICASARSRHPSQSLSVTALDSRGQRLLRALRDAPCLRGPSFSGRQRTLARLAMDAELSVAERAGVPVVEVDPRNTSRECPECGHIDKRNRRTQAAFRCRGCGHTGHADCVAAENIRRRGERQLARNCEKRGELRLAREYCDNPRPSGRGVDRQLSSGFGSVLTEPLRAWCNGYASYRSFVFATRRLHAKHFLLRTFPVLMTSARDRLGQRPSGRAKLFIVIDVDDQRTGKRSRGLFQRLLLRNSVWQGGDVIRNIVTHAIRVCVNTRQAASRSNREVRRSSRGRQFLRHGFGNLLRPAAGQRCRPGPNLHRRRARRRRQKTSKNESRLIRIPTRIRWLQVEEP